MVIAEIVSGRAENTVRAGTAEFTNADVVNEESFVITFFGKFVSKVQQCLFSYIVGEYRSVIIMFANIVQ